MIDLVSLRTTFLIFIHWGWGVLVGSSSSSHFAYLLKALLFSWLVYCVWVLMLFYPLLFYCLMLYLFSSEFIPFFGE